VHKQIILTIICLLATIDLSGSLFFGSFGYLFAPTHDLPKNSFSEIVSTRINLSSITVSSTGDGSFTSINSALNWIVDYCNSGLYNGEPIRIRVMPGAGEAGTYAEDIDISPLAAYPISSFTLEGIGEVIIEGQITLNYLAGSSISGSIYQIKGLQITNTTRGIVFTDTWNDNANEEHNPHLRLTIDSCHIIDCGTTQYNEQSPYSAAGIHFEGAGVIKNSAFVDNQITAFSANYSSSCKAGAVYVLNNSTESVEITNNTFTNNWGAISGGIVLNGTGAINVLQNRFEQNIVCGYCSDVYQNRQGHAISVFDAANDTITNNLFINNFPSNYEGTTVYLENVSGSPQGSTPIVFENNTIYNNLPEYPGNVTSALTFNYIVNPPSLQDIVMRNNIFSCANAPSATSGVRVTSANGYSNPNLSYNIFHNTNPEG